MHCHSLHFVKFPYTFSNLYLLYHVSFVQKEGETFVFEGVFYQTSQETIPGSFHDTKTPHEKYPHAVSLPISYLLCFRTYACITSSVFSRSAFVWAADKNMASNWAGAR